MSTKAEPWAGRDPQWTDPQKDFEYWALMKPPHYPKNKYIEQKLWTPRLDYVLRECVAQMDWWYVFPTIDRVMTMLDQEAYAAWTKTDPLCKEYSALGVLAEFITHQVWDLGLRNDVAPPVQKICAICESRFLESSVHRTFAYRLRYRANVFCGACSSAIRQYALLNDRASILAYAHGLHEITGVAPPPDFGMDAGCFSFMSWEDISKILVLLRCGCPNPEAVRREFGSWFSVLNDAGLLPDGIRVTARGYQCQAQDGHLCLSLGERTIDDFLYSEGIEHEREPRYPFGRYRADFRIQRTLIEYAGLTGNEQYDDKMATKIRTARNVGIEVLVVYPHDLFSRESLRHALGPVLGRSVQRR